MTSLMQNLNHHKWTAVTTIRKPTRQGYYASDVAVYQYGVISNREHFYGSFPSIIKRKKIGNDMTLQKINNLEDRGELLNVFLTQTPNGKSTQRILDRIGFKATDTIVVNYAGNITDVYVLIKPDENRHEIFSIHSANKPESVEDNKPVPQTGRFRTYPVV